MLPIIIDGTDYSDVIIIDKLTETGTLQEGIGRMVRQDGSDWFDILGTRFTRTIEIRRNRSAQRANWDAFYDVITAPVGVHSVTIGNKVFNAHIESAERELLDFVSVNGEDTEVWGNSYTVTFTGTQPEVTP